MAEEGKADWEVRLERLFEKPLTRARADRVVPAPQLQKLLTDIERAAGAAKSYLASNMTREMRLELNKLRSLLRVLKKGPPGGTSPSSPEEFASLEDAFRAVVRILKERHPEIDYKALLDEVDAWLSDRLDEAVRAEDFPETRRLSVLIEALRVVEREERVFSSRGSPPRKTGKSGHSQSAELEVLRETVSFPSIRELAGVGAV